MVAIDGVIADPKIATVTKSVNTGVVVVITIMRVVTVMKALVWHVRLVLRVIVILLLPPPSKLLHSSTATCSEVSGAWCQAVKVILMMTHMTV